MKVSRANSFEAVFRQFVDSIGGEVLLEAPSGHTADYLFRNDNVIAELKTLSVDVTDDMNRKLRPVVEKWAKANGRMPPGEVKGDQYILDMRNMPPEIQSAWLRLLMASVEHLVRDANRQIRDTKERLELPSAKGLIIVANEGNFYHADPKSFRSLIAEILRKRTPEKALRFPNVHAAVYFSLKDVKSRNEGMYFWANLQMQQDPNEDVGPMAAFQERLQQGWYQYVEEGTGVAVRRHREIG
jgi:hypothetical protein